MSGDWKYVLFQTITIVAESVMKVGSDTFGDPIFQMGLQN